MRQTYLYLFLILTVAQNINAQTRGTKLGYIDMEYILQNVPNYKEAEAQLEQKTQKWKLEIETKKIEINKLKEELKAEKALLTKELITERETEISFLENENLAYQQQRFGPNGDLIKQKTVLVKPLQDQIFTAIQDIAEAKKYDFIFDKSSDLTMLFAAKRFDISEQVLIVLNRSDKREQLTKKQLKEEELRNNKEDTTDENPALADGQKILDDKKVARDKLLEDRKSAQEQRKKEFDDKRKQIIADKEAKKAGTISANSKTTDTNIDIVADDLDKNNDTKNTDLAKQSQADARNKTLEDRKKVIEDRKKDLEDRRKKIIQDRESAKKAREEKLKENTNNN